jgi:hypothetical protein
VLPADRYLGVGSGLVAAGTIEDSQTKYGGAPMGTACDVKLRDIWDVCRRFGRYKFHKDWRNHDLGVEHVLGGKPHTLLHIRPDVTAKGYPTFKRVHVVEDGIGKWYDGNHSFPVTALIIDGQRKEF